ncbi:MAG: transposase [Actinomycetota bacterium]|nr:transposase [Actinomycetota bacterium]
MGRGTGLPRASSIRPPSGWTEPRRRCAAFSAFPKEHWRQIWSTNSLERLNKELRRRCRVVGIFPNEASVMRLAGSVLIDAHDEWQASERRYFSLESMAKLAGPGSTPVLTESP